MSGESYVFSVHLATKYGVDKAIMIHHLQYWIGFNQRAEKNHHEGRTWMYQSQKDMAAHFPFWNRDYIQKLLSELVADGVIRKGNFNNNGFDRTQWYSFENEKMFTIVPNSTMDGAKQHNRKCQTAQTIYTDSETYAEDKQQQPAAPVAVFSCMDNLDKSVTEREKIRICKKHSEQEVKQAIEAAKATKPTESFLKTLNAALRDKWPIPKNIKGNSEENKKYAEQVETAINPKDLKKTGYNLIISNAYLEINHANGQCIQYKFTDSDFREKVAMELLTRNIYKPKEERT